ncbi:hypothetical protein POP12_145 [Pectobacterium phage POP12]|nr:hypothetical protein POP12_145 [Pectobacterium phage POP12]
MILASRHERDVKIYAHHMMKLHGLVDNGWKFAINGRMTRALGLCNYSKKTISLSKKFVKVACLDDITDTVLHEIAHALVGYNHGHGSVWQAKAIEIGAIPSATKKVKFGEDSNEIVPVLYLEKESGIEVMSSITMNKYTKIKSGRININTLYFPKRKAETLGNLKAMLLNTKEYEKLKAK